MQANWSNDSLSTTATNSTSNLQDQSQTQNQLKRIQDSKDSTPQPYSAKVFDPLLPRKHHTRPRSQNRRDGKGGGMIGSGVGVGAGGSNVNGSGNNPMNPNLDPNLNPNRASTSNHKQSSTSTSSSIINPTPQSHPYFTQPQPQPQTHQSSYSPTASIISSSRTASSAGIEADRDSHLEISSSSELDQYVNRNRKRGRNNRREERKLYPLSTIGGGATSNERDRDNRDPSEDDDDTTQSEEEEEDGWLNQTTSEEGGNGSKRFDWDRRRGNDSRRNSSSIRKQQSFQLDGSGNGSGEHQSRHSNRKRTTFDISSFTTAGSYFSLGKRRGSAPDISHGKASSNVHHQDRDQDTFDSQQERPIWLDTGILPSGPEEEILPNSKKSPISKGLRRFSSREADRPSRNSMKRSSFNFGLSETTRARLRAVLPQGLLSADLSNPNLLSNESQEAKRSNSGTVAVDPPERQGGGGRIRSYSPAPVFVEGSSGKEELSDKSRGKKSSIGLDGTGSSSGEAVIKPRRSSRLLEVDPKELRKEGNPSFTKELVEEPETEIKDDKSMSAFDEIVRASSPAHGNSAKNRGSDSKIQSNTLRIPTSNLRRSPSEGSTQLPASQGTTPPSSRHSPSASSRPLSPPAQNLSTRRPLPRSSKKRTRLRASLHSHLRSSTFRITLSSFLEGLILLLPAYYAIHRLLTREMEIVGGKDTEIGKLMSSAALELSWVAISSTIYWLIEKRDGKGFNSSGSNLHSKSKENHNNKDKLEPNAIWATDERNYRNCSDDGVLYGLLFGPLLACTSFFSSLPEKSRLNPSSSFLPVSTSIFNQRFSNSLPSSPSSSSSFFSSALISNTLPSNFLLPDQNPILLHSRSLIFPPLPLARASLITIQSLTSTALLAHLLATKWIRKPSEFEKSNWKRMRSFFGFSLVLVMVMEVIREGSSWLGIGFWTGLARWELFTASLVYQLNLYTISRLARRSFTLGELAIVSTLGVTLLMESVYLTIAKLWPFTTSYIKTFRNPTPLLYFQLALVVGTFIIGFLLSPLLYLSRNLAQKPLHRLRWPAKRDLHRRLLAGFFYFFASAFVVGVLGMWVRWLLGNKDPWFWVMKFVLEGKYTWSRPLLMVYWLGLVSISIIGWQTVVVRNKRIRLRAGNSRNINGMNTNKQNILSNSNSIHNRNQSNLNSISAVPINSDKNTSGNGQAGMEIIDPSKRSNVSSTTTSVSLGLSNLSNFSSNLNPFSSGFHQVNSNKEPNSLALGSLPAPNPNLNPTSNVSSPGTPLSPPIQSTPPGLSFTTSNSIEGSGNNSTSTPSSHLKKAAHLSLNARRKFFHALAVFMFVPGIVLDPAFTHLAFSLCFSLFIFGEYVRYYALYPFGATLHVFLSEFLDSKDSGPVILSHFYLLTGCAGPLWLEGNSIIVQVNGVLVLGVGDALASIVGRRYGKKKWWTGNKTLEGTMAFWGSIMFCAWVLRILGLVEKFNLLGYSILIAILALLEGVSAQNDNLILPAFGSILSTLLEI